ncbi:MAG: hypothetical protein KJO07_03685, partial [Deltaproteobacteria bacterium]|nr:hypothetical protein [Deltaproteobacteria bacterium]
SDFDRTVDPDHRMAMFPSDCTLCHTTSRWLGATFTHDAGYLLEGAHVGLACGACHQERFDISSTDCFSCHQDEWAAAEPDHQVAGFETECATCHDQSSWQRASFDHSTFWRLTGGHRRLECEDCHAQGYAGTSSECYACHRRDYRRVADPNHRAAGFGTECQECHGTRSWSGAQIDHNEVFYLAGAHRRLDCQACHADGYTGTPRECYGCHQDDYMAVPDPNHRRAGYSTQCTDCHNATAWDEVELDHGAIFPLTGAHNAVDCAGCHASGYAGTPTDCISCHRADYNAAQDPDHRAGGLATSCLDCHTTHGWSNAAFDHQGDFPLTGAHNAVDCAGCHSSGYAGTPTDCLGCHRAEYNAVRDPNHRVAGFTDCASCHDTTSWRGADFDHGPFYALTGSHTTIGCESCHAAGYAGTPRDCFECHFDDYNGAADPDHSMGFPRDCTICHDTDRWSGAVWDHNASWPLTGVHARIDCSRCHSDGFAGTARECAGCHLDDYERTVNPWHGAADFPLQCETCHSTSVWYGALFKEHDSRFFPIYSGTHQGVWGSCRTCHRVKANYQSSSCTVCHIHRRDKMDRAHGTVAGYEFLDAACYSCHPTGEV